MLLPSNLELSCTALVLFWEPSPIFTSFLSSNFDNQAHPQTGIIRANMNKHLSITNPSDMDWYHSRIYELKIPSFYKINTPNIFKTLPSVLMLDLGL